MTSAVAWTTLAQCYVRQEDDFGRRSNTHSDPQQDDRGAPAAIEMTLGLDVRKDEQLMWIAQHAAVLELPAPWVDFEDATGEKAEYRPASYPTPRFAKIICLRMVRDFLELF